MSDSNRIDAASWLAILRRSWWAILMAGILAAALALGLSLVRADRYQATAEVLFETDDLDRTLLGVSGQEPQAAPERIAATNLQLASLERIAVNVHRRLDMGLTLEELRDRVEIAPKGQSDIVALTAEADSRDAAVKLANAFAAEVVAFRRGVAQQRVQRAIDALRLAQPAPTPGVPPPVPVAGEVTPERRIEQLTAIKATQQGNAELIQPATPPRDRAAPKPLRSTLIGGAIGLILGAFAVALVYTLDRRVQDHEEIARLAGGPILARVPTGRRSRTEQVFEALQFLRANLRLQDPGHASRVIAVTSPESGDGKTTIAAGLAEVLAYSGSSVVVVDCDLRSPALHEHLQVDNAAGLADALVGHGQPEEFLQEASPGLRVLSAGQTSLDAFSLAVGLQRLSDVLARLRDSADYVIVDTPPITAAADASTVTAATDGVILVVDPSRARRDVLSAVHDQLMYARVPLLGVVINRDVAPMFGAMYGRRQAPQEEEPDAVLPQP